MVPRLCICVVLQTIFFTLAQKPINEECTTPHQQYGICISARSCEPILDLLASLPQPVPPEIKTVVQSYQCGVEGRVPKVCCPSTPISLDLVNPQKPNSQFPDVSRHPNINLLPHNCGVFDTENRIVYGNKTGLFEFPWMALLSYRTYNGPRFQCGGTIINKRYILTAAHCILNTKFPLLGVRVGDHNINTAEDCEDDNCAPPFQDLRIEKIIHHPQYDPRAYANDIGLLRVSPINLKLENAKPVCLPLEDSRNYNFTNRNVVVTGWGVTETGKSSPELLKVELPVVPLVACKEAYKNVIALNDRQMCAGGNSKSDSCGGDSGGPLHALSFLRGDLRMVQQGIVSFGPVKCGQEALPGVYTRVASYMDWILDNIQP